MPAERLKDTNEGWGLSMVENAHREKQKLRERMKKRAQRARVKQETRAIVPVDNLFKIVPAFRLKAQDIQCLGILAVRNKVTNISLPWVTLLHGSVR